MQLINYAMQRLLAFAFIIFMICVSNRVVNAQTLENELYDQNLEEDTETTEELSTEALEVSVEDSVVHTTDELFEEDFVIEPEIDSEETPAEIVEPSSEPDSSEEILIEELPAEPAEPLDQPIEQEYVETDLEQEVIDTDLELTKEEPNYEIRPIGNNLYFVNTETGEVRKDNAWIDYKGYHIFPNKEGILYRNQFITFGPAYKHYMDSEGKAARGLKQVGNNLYYFDESTDEPLKRGVMRKDNKWVKPNGSTESVFVNDKGLVYRNQWITFGPEKAYYMGNDGYKVKGEIKAFGANLHFTDPDTGNVRRDNAWIDYKDYHVFPNKEGILYRNQFITFGPEYKHYMDSEGKASKGLKQVGNDLYYFDESTTEPLKRGVMRKDNKWVKPNGSTESVFVNDKGLVYRNQWITFGSEEAYYMGNDGYKVKGRVIARGNNLHFTDPITGNVRKDNSWIDYGEHRIFPNKEGILYRNQFITFGPDVAYYMNNSGFAHKGFLEINNKLYYFNVNTAQLMRDAFVVDLSTWQDPNKMNFDLIAEQISGAILRIGTSNRESGIGYLKDNNFERFYSEFTSRNIPVGAYWYSIATSREQGIGEANEVLKHIRGKKFELPIYWDTENQKFQAPATAEKLTDAALGFLSTLKNNGYYAGIYGSTWWLENKLLMNRLSAYQVWVARWNAQTPEYSGDYGMWQFTSRGSLAGYNGDLDLSIIFKDYPQIIKNGGYNGY